MGELAGRVEERPPEGHPNMDGLDQREGRGGGGGRAHPSLSNRT
jgi:hypothetical protein